MNTTYEPVDRDFLFSLALAKAKGRTWQQISEKAKMPVIDLEIIPWREPKEWAKACKYAEKLVHHETLSELLATLRGQMNDPVNNGRLKTQIANSVVRAIQLQHTLRTPKKPKKTKLSPITEPILTPTPNEPLVGPTIVESPIATPTPTTNPVPLAKSTGQPIATVAAIVLLLLMGTFGVVQRFSRPTEAPKQAEIWIEQTPLIATLANHEAPPDAPFLASNVEQSACCKILLNNHLTHKQSIRHGQRRGSHVGVSGLGHLARSGIT